MLCSGLGELMKSHVFAHSSQESIYSYVLKGLISISTAILLGLVVMYHAREIQVRVLMNSTSQQKLHYAALICRIP